MIYALEERIGDPYLFCGRQHEMDMLIKWVNMIPHKSAKSRALLGRRKSGKSSIIQRLFNIIWNKNGKVIRLMQMHLNWMFSLWEGMVMPVGRWYSRSKTAMQSIPQLHTKRIVFS